MGGVHLIRLLDFGDTKWIARVQLKPSTESSASLLRSDIGEAELVSARTKIPVPKIFGYELDDANEVHAAFVLMEFFHGPSAMDAEGGFEVHWGQIPPARRESFYREVAGIQVEMASIRMPKIGSIIRNDDNSFDVGPIPGLGGPFSTATEFFRAWARHAKFPTSDSKIRQCMGNGPVEEVMRSIKDFPNCLERLACHISTTNDSGPFPLYHPDFYQSNIIVDEQFKVLSVIDWEGASTVPWELVQLPLFLGFLPPKMGDPNNYEPDGRPKDEDDRRRLHERSEYVKHVQAKEHELNTDRKLSGILLNPDVQALAYAIKVYLDPGKMGFYCEVLEPFDSSS